MKTCNYCGEKHTHIKALISHYQEKHPELVKRYEIRNKRLGQKAIWSATTEDEVLGILGWDKKDCKVREMK